MTKCDNCGEEYGIGDWPFCPHGDTCFEVDHFEPYFDEHLSTDGEMISSRRQRRKIMDKNGFDYHKNKQEQKIARGATGKLLFFDMGGR